LSFKEKSKSKSGSFGFVFTEGNLKGATSEAKLTPDKFKT
jgi:hypothetical protein